MLSEGMRERPESLVIRPPSEWRSVLVRLTRGCQWNRCLFCGIYPALGEPGFSVRAVGEVKADIDMLRRRVTRAETVFFGDGDPLQVGLGAFIEIARYLRQVFPEVRRLTCYARASTLWTLKEAGIRQLAEAGLNRVHLGLESGEPELLRFHRKGQRPETVIAACRWLKDAGIEISCYILLGMGGRDRWEAHADATAQVVTAIDPEFVRLRRLWIYGGDGAGPESPLWAAIREGTFVPQTPEGTVRELRRFIERLGDVHTRIVCDHANNYLRVEGAMPHDRARMIEAIDTFLALPKGERVARYEMMASTI